LTLPKDNPDKNKHQYCAQATATELISAITGQKSAEKIVHRIMF
jgi:hypothetical protein